jgi:Uma2 family endonuclease
MANSTLMPDGSLVSVPFWVVDHASFLRWAESDEAPEKGKINYYHGAVQIDNGAEEILHSLIKCEIGVAIMAKFRPIKLGQFYVDGMSFTNYDAAFTSVPDGMFVTRQSWQTSRVQCDQGWRSTQLHGSPDLILEVVSHSSVTKDLIDMRALYYEAGVKEYWIVDSRVRQPKLQILERCKTGFDERHDSQGWVRSSVLNTECQLSIDEVKEIVDLELRSSP